MKVGLIVGWGERLEWEGRWGRGGEEEGGTVNRLQTENVQHPDKLEVIFSCSHNYNTDEYALQ